MDPTTIEGAVQGGIAQADAASGYATTPTEEADVKEWRERIDRARSRDSSYRDRWADDRRVARNEPKPGEGEWIVDTPLIGSILEVLLAFLYAKDPDVSVRPSPAVSKKRKQMILEFARTVEIVASRLMKDALLKRKARRWVRGTMTVGLNWLKAAFQTRVGPDPIVEQRLNDLTDNAKRIEVLQAMIASGDYDQEKAEAELESQQVALSAKREREFADGVVLDVMPPEDVIVAPECGPVENYLDAPYIGFDLYLEPVEAAKALGWNTEEQLSCLKKANRFMQRKAGNKEGGDTITYVPVTDTDAESANGFIRITEVWSKKDGVVLTLIDGINDRWGRPKYAPRTGRRFYPCFDLMFHPIDCERYPQSDVFHLKKLQEEYARTRSNKAEHRRRAIPGMVFDKRQLTPESVEALRTSKTQEYVGVETIGWNPDLRTLLVPKTYNPVDPGLYDTSDIRQEMEEVSGAQDAMRSSVAVPKTATEAEIENTGFGARTGTRRDVMEDSLTELYQYIIELALQVMDQADAVRYAGEDAVWVQLSVEEALSLFDIEVQAGSTGKPKAKSDREAWATLMPLIKEIMGIIGAARTRGEEWAAKPLIALLEETFKRLDDRVDIERFLPVPPAPVLPGMPPGVPGDPNAMPGGPPPLDASNEIPAAPAAVA